jgi:RNA polymerase sigma-70 factor (ECF subfamily)
VLSATMTEKIGATLPEGFERLYRQYASFIYRTALRITRSAEESEDILQTIFLRLIRNGCPPTLLRQPMAYFHRAAVNGALDAIRRRRSRASGKDVREIGVVLHSPDSNFDEKIDRSLSQAIKELSPSAVEMLVLRYTHGYSDAEIAKMLGKSRGVVAVTLYRSRARLKRLIKPIQGDKL